MDPLEFSRLIDLLMSEGRARSNAARFGEFKEASKHAHAADGLKRALIEAFRVANERGVEWYP